MEPIEVITASAHPTRRRVVEHLVLHGACQVGTLATALDQQVGSISHHLRVLERVGVVERAPELATDGRTSWWRAATVTLSWAAEDFEDRPAVHVIARAAERANVQHHLDKLRTWLRGRDGTTEVWRRAAFSTDSIALATPEELERLGTALGSVVQEWRTSIATGDGQGREPVYVFAHGFPSAP